MSSVRETAAQAIRAVHEVYGPAAPALLGLSRNQVQRVVRGAVPHEATAARVVEAAATLPLEAPEPWPLCGARIVARCGGVREAAAIAGVSRQAADKWAAGAIPSAPALLAMQGAGIITEHEVLRARVQAARDAERRRGGVA